MKCFRAMVVNAAQLASYSQAKQAILGSGYIQVKDENNFLLLGEVISSL